MPTAVEMDGKFISRRQGGPFKGEEAKDMKTHLAIVMLAGVFLVTSCGAPPRGTSAATPAEKPSPSPAALQGEGPTQSPESAWQAYTNAEAGFGIRYPSTWQMEALPDDNAGQLHRVLFRGPEGGLQLEWGTGVGGACPEGYQPLKVAQGDLPACHIQNADGTEQWSLAGRQLGQISFTATAYTSNTDASSRDLVLQILSTLSFP